MRMMPPHRHAARLCAAALACGLLLAFVACSASSGSGAGGIPLSGLGSLLSTPAGTPTVADSTLGGPYAFVFGNQVWIKRAQDTAPSQLTHLPIAGGSYLAWGPLAWSPDGTQIAFALVQDISGADHPRSAGPLYVVDTTTGAVQATAGTASVYGHAYAWYGNNALFYSDGSGIAFYDLFDRTDPRAYVAVPASNGPDMSTGVPEYLSYGDIAFSGQRLFVTRIAAATLGGVGQVGRAAIYQYGLPQTPGGYAGGGMGIDNSVGIAGFAAASLGVAYADAQGNLLAGSWQLAPTGAAVVQQIDGIDAKAGTVSAHICYDVYIGDYCDQSLFASASKLPIGTPPQFALATGGGLVAMAGQTLDTERIDGSQLSAFAPGAWGQPPQWSPDDKLVTATQLVSATPGASGVVHFETNVLAYALGGKSSVLVAQGQDFSWGPQT